MNQPATAPRARDAAPPRGRILRVKAGYNPNSSSLGTVVFAVPAAMLLAPAVYNAIAAALAGRAVRDRPAPHGRQDRAPAEPKTPPEDGTTP